MQPGATAAPRGTSSLHRAGPSAVLSRGCCSAADISKRTSMVTQREIANRVRLDVSRIIEILNRRPGPVFKKVTIKQGFKVARQLGYDFGKLKFNHRRRHDRRVLGVTAEVAVYSEQWELLEKGSGPGGPIPRRSPPSESLACDASTQSRHAGRAAH